MSTALALKGNKNVERGDGGRSDVPMGVGVQDRTSTSLLRGNTQLARQWIV